MAFLDFLFDPGKPYRRAQDQYKQGLEEAQKYYEPYLEHGQESGQSLADLMSRLQNPQQFEQELMSGYSLSPMAQDKLARNLQEGQDIAGSLGLGGSSAALQDIYQGAGRIQNEDEQAYRNRLMQDYLTSIGIGQQFYGTGAQTASNAANLTQGGYGNMAQSAYGAAAAPGQLFGQLANLGLKGYGAYNLQQPQGYYQLPPQAVGGY